MFRVVDKEGHVILVVAYAALVEDVNDAYLVMSIVLKGIVDASYGVSERLSNPERPSI